MNLLFFSSALFSICSAFCPLDINSKVDYECLHNKAEILVLVSSGQLKEGFKFVLNGIAYQAVVKGGRYTFISTNDAKFKTPEGISMNTTVSQLKVDKSSLKLRPGWGKTYKLNSGWICAFSFEKKISNDSKVIFFFKE